MYKILLSPYSRIFYNEWKLNSNTKDYNIVFSQKLKGNLNVIQLKNALERFVSENILLNSHLMEEHEELFWVKNEEISSLSYIDEELSCIDIKNLSEKPFDLLKGPLYKFYLIKTNEKQYKFIIILHHLLIDGSTISYFCNTVSNYYNDVLYKNPFALEEQVEKIETLSNSLKNKLLTHRDKSKQFWNEHLSDFEFSDSTFLYDKSTSSQFKIKEGSFQENHKIKELRFSFSQEILEKINALKKKIISPYFYGRGIFAFLISKYTGQKKICISYPVAIHEGRNFMYGGQVNTTLIFYDFSHINDFEELFNQAKNFTSSLKTEYINHSYLPIFEMPNLNRNLLDFTYSTTSLRDIPFEFNDVTASIDNELGIDLIADWLFEQGVSNSTINCVIRYRSNKIDSYLLEEFIEVYKKLFIEVLEDLNIDSPPLRKINNYELLTSFRLKNIMQDWNNTNKTYPMNKMLHQIFEEQVKKTPNTLAVVYEEKKLTYQELNEEANKLANYLRDTYNIQPEDFVALCLDRSEHIIIGILAILKAGAAYVPLEPTYPDERIKYILNDTKAKAVLVNEIYKERVGNIFCLTRIVAIDAIETQLLLDNQNRTNVFAFAKSTNLAYVIYTSGTTGVPKGVMIEHNSVINLLFQINLENQFMPNKKGILWTNINFDVSVYEIFTMLINGCTSHILSSTVREDPRLLFTYIEEHRINYAYIPPYFLTEFPINRIFSLEFLLVGVEKIKFSSLENILSSNKAIKILNGYGPTEATVFCTNYLYNSQDKYLENLPIGTPVSNMSCYVLDENLNPLPMGAIGELYITGAGLSRGYLNSPDLTKEKFFKNPFQTKSQKELNENSMLYKSGDLVRWLSNGNLEYIGRNDFQVKIRGYRIEVNEIENILNSHPDINNSIVICKSNVNNLNEKYLVGYYTAKKKMEEQEVSKYLYKRLPEYMVPHVVLQLDNFPSTLNGKLDRQALPEPKFSSYGGFIAPKTELENTLCDIWAAVLNLTKEKIGVKDNFFRLGGDSILAIKLASKVSKVLNKDVSVAFILNHTTITSFIDGLEAIPVLHQEIKKFDALNIEEQLLSFSQERLWFVEKYEEGTNAYNVPMIFKLCNGISLDILENSIRSMVSRHEILRTLIKETDEGHTYQYTIDDSISPFSIERLNFTERDQLDKSITKKVNYKFDLQNELPIKAFFYSLKNNDNVENYLISIIHHVAFDGWSCNIFLNELEQFYFFHLESALGLSSDLSLPALSIQYKDFALWQRNYLSKQVLKKQLGYWRSKLEGYETLNLFTDYPRPIKINYCGEILNFEINEELSNKLRLLAQELEVSLFNVLLAGYYLMLSIYSNQTDIIVGIPIANRHYKQLESLIGCFINTLPLRVKINFEDLICNFISQVAKETLEAQLYQDFPFEKIVSELNIPKDTSSHPIFKVMFGVQKFGINTSSQLFENYKSAEHFYKISKFDISTFIDDSEANLKGSFSYAPHLYSKATIQRFVEIYTEILEKFTLHAKIANQKKQIRICDLSYLPKREQEILLKDWSSMTKEHINEKTISLLFEEQVLKTPDNISIVTQDKKLTYRQLNEKANQLAHYINTICQISPDNLIAVCLDRNEDLLIGLLAVLKAGGAYAPIDPDCPNARISYQIEDTGAKIILTNETHEEKLKNIVSLGKNSSCNVLAINSYQCQQQMALQSKDNLHISATIDNLAYVIYTSGTTGKPKGVMIEHKAYVNFINYIRKLYFENKQDIKTYSLTNYVFDIFGLEYGLPLLSGGTLTIGTKYFDVLDCSKFDFIQMTPSLCKLKLDCLENTADVKLLVGGEKLSKNLLDKILSKSINVVNLYGPTETTIWSTSKSYDSTENSYSVTLGKPFKNESIYILGNHLELLPIGAIGEIHIGGIGVGRGYLNKPELTEEKFILNPFFTSDHSNCISERLYKTGDLGRWLPNGEIEFIGRNDFQIKINGYRIEIGEIENAMLSYSGIQQAAVLIRKNEDINTEAFQDKYLVVYYMSDKNLDEDSILNHLAGKIPSYMMPRSLISLENFPLTINGKLDENALLKLPIKTLQKEPLIISENNHYEKIISTAWSKVLGVNILSKNDSFFDLGGNSLLLAEMYSQLPNNIKEKLTIMHFFQYTTISRISKFLSN